MWMTSTDELNIGDRVEVNDGNTAICGLITGILDPNTLALEKVTIDGQQTAPRRILVTMTWHVRKIQRLPSEVRCACGESHE